MIGNSAVFEELGTILATGMTPVSLQTRSACRTLRSQRAECAAAKRRDIKVIVESDIGCIR